MRDDRNLWPVNAQRINWDRVSMIPAGYWGGSALIYQGTGHLGIVDHQLVFKLSRNEIEFDLERIAYFSLLRMAQTSDQSPALTVHYPTEKRWEVHAFELTLDRFHMFTEKLLRAYPAAPLAPYLDYGPKTARLYEQDIYGAWSLVPTFRGCRSKK